MRDLLIGLDAGTGGMRAFVFDKQGNVLASRRTTQTLDEYEKTL